MKTKILADFEICISVPLSCNLPRATKVCLVLYQTAAYLAIYTDLFSLILHFYRSFYDAMLKWLSQRHKFIE